MMGRRGSDDLLSDASEVSKVVADMSKRMQDHLETQRNVDRDAKVKDLARLDEYKKKVSLLRTKILNDGKRNVRERVVCDAIQC